MRRITQRKSFRKDLKRMQKRDRDTHKLFFVVEQLSRTGILDAKFRSHKLTGTWSDFSECHIEPDWLLIYNVNDSEVLLVRTGTHADLFE
jgi:mRNA interferase YafQ